MVRGATKSQQNKYMGKEVEVATSWGGKLHSGKATKVYNATADYNEGDYTRWACTVYTVTWDDWDGLDADQLTDEVGLEELQALIGAAGLGEVQSCCT